MRQALERRSRTVAAALLLSLPALSAPALTVAPEGIGAYEPTVASASSGRTASTAAIPQALGHGPRPADARSDPPARPRAIGGVVPVADPTLPGRLQAALDAALAGSEARGISAAIVRDGGLVWEGASGSASGAEGPMPVDAPMVIGSITKTFVAAAVLQLADEGLLEIERPVRRYLPALPVSDEITVRQLLDHTSGLADLFNDTTRTAIEEHPERPWDRFQLLEALHEPWYPPGEGWAYANTNYLILAMLVEQVTGAPLGDELARRFIEPLGLEATALIAADGDGQALAPAWATIFWGSGAMVSSATDLARWGDALYGADLLDRTTLEQMIDFNDHDHGLGLQRIELGGVEGYGHSGLLNHYTTLLLHLPRDGVTIAVLVNRARVDLGAVLTARPEGGPSILELIRPRK